MKIIESDIDLKNNYLYRQDVKLVVPVWSSPRGHEHMFPISFYYIRTTFDEYIININHIDARTLSNFEIGEYVNDNTLIYNSRYLNVGGLDYEYVYFEHNRTPFNFKEFSRGLYTTYRGDYTMLNDCIPLMKWAELLHDMEYIQERNSWYNRYTDYINTLGRLEGAGVCVDKKNFIDTFGFPIDYIDSNNLVYTKYNPYTTTGRPSNHHLGINWAALNKSDGSRKSIISRFGRNNGTLIQFDFESYHLRLIAKMAGFRLDVNDVHQYFANQYGVDRETGKGITFKYLYGGLDDAAKTLPFFEAVNLWLIDLWQTTIDKGYLETWIDKRRIPLEQIDNPNPQKVFNYMIQSAETEVNMRKIPTIFNSMQGLNANNYQSKFVLYTYDAFLVDVLDSERDEIINLFTTVMSKGGFPVKISEGNNYDELTLLK